MTRILGTNTQTTRPFRATRPSLSNRISARPIVTIQPDLVNDEPIEEVIFEPNCGVDQRATRLGYVITEAAEDAALQPQGPRSGQDHFWQGFSAPFMAQVIGQHVAPQAPRVRAYSRTVPAATRAPRPRFSTAC